MKIITNSPDETFRLGFKLGGKLKNGDVLSLNGEFGTGKTWLAKGIAAGLDVPSYEYVNSPAFDLVHEYEGKYPVFHMDFYKIDILTDEDIPWLDEYFDKQGIIIIEWGDKFIDQFTDSYLRIEILHVGIYSDKREIILVAKGERYLQLLNELSDERIGN